MKSRYDAVWSVRRLINRLGIDVVPYAFTRHPVARRLHLFAHRGVDLVLDVGANGGQYGRFLRRIGYRGDILSFEPLLSAFAGLQSNAAADGAWEARRCALGAQPGTATLNVAQNSESSSILSMLPAHLAAYPGSGYVSTEEVPVTTLAEVLAGVPNHRSIFVKVDTQGYERNVIEGAGDALSRVLGVQLEMSLVPLYEGELLLPEMINFMTERGLVLMGIEPGSSDRSTGQLLQVDGLFFRSGPSAAPA